MKSHEAQSVGILPVGGGNVMSVKRAFGAFIENVEVTNSIDFKCSQYDWLVLPGVGNFSQLSSSSESLRTETVVRHVYDHGCSVIAGLCLGYQAMFESSDEAPEVDGFGLLPGRVTKIGSGSSKPTYSMHIGFNNVQTDDVTDVGMLLSKYDYYFVHEYAVRISEEHRSMDLIGTTSLGSEDFLTFVKFRNLIGMQFHPEKSQAQGLLLLRELLKSC